MVWNYKQTAWDEGYKHAEEYLKQLNGAAWKTTYVSPDGYKTGAWLHGQVRAKEKGRLSPENETLLKKIGVRFAQKPAVKRSRKRKNTIVIAQGVNP